MLPITPKTKVGALLDAYPELEDVLIDMAPAFRKLKNPVLRRTIAKVATLQQAALTGDVPVGTVIRRLREAVGQETGDWPVTSSTGQSPAEPPPSWLHAVPTEEIDAGPMIDRGENPLHEAIAAVARMPGGAILRIRAPFYPAPLVDTLRGMGNDVHTEEGGGTWSVHVRKKE
ncbi:MAG: DUF1858 domain-containing protein [Bacteroidota bacterium]|nr:DUF1858 domain-containing protein [Bacteroidota bacterium]